MVKWIFYYSTYKINDTWNISVPSDHHLEASAASGASTCAKLKTFFDEAQVAEVDPLMLVSILLYHPQALMRLEAFKLGCRILRDPNVALQEARPAVNGLEKGTFLGKGKRDSGNFLVLVGRDFWPFCWCWCCGIVWIHGCWIGTLFGGHAIAGLKVEASSKWLILIGFVTVY